jgi:hypothetical protein
MSEVLEKNPETAALSKAAARHCLNVTHDLEANGFFVNLSVASRDLPDLGLGHWVGEAAMRTVYRDGRRRSRLRGSAPASDGCGRCSKTMPEIPGKLGSAYTRAR